MNIRNDIRLACAIAGALGAACAQADDQQLVSPADMRETVTVENVRVDGTQVTGTIVNNTSRRLENPQLVVRHNWIWKNEYHPGPDSPGWADFATVSQTIEPHQRADFTVEASRPAPERDDGHIVIWADVLEIVAAK